MSDITLSAAVRSNLLSLQNTATLLDTTQTRLATGNKVNSALDNPTSYFTASALNSRASDLGNLLDSVGNAIQTIQAANDGITSITKLVESAQATANQAQQLQATVANATAGTATAQSAETSTDVSSTGTVNTIAGGSFTADDWTAGGAQISFNLTIGGTTQAITITNADITAADHTAVTATELTNALNTKINTAFSTTGVNYAVVNGGKIDINGGTANTSVTIGGFAAAGGIAGTGLANGSGTGGAAAASLSFTVALDGGSASTVTLSKATVDAYNTAKSTSISAGALTAQNIADIANYQLGSNVATVSGGKLVFTSTTTGASSTVAVSTVTAAGGATNNTGITGALSGTGGTTNIANPARGALISQYNGLLDQIDSLTADAGYNGNNLLTSAGNVKVVFNETGTSSLTISGKDTTFTGLGLAKLASNGFDTNAGITNILGSLKTAQDTLRSDASSFGSNLSIVQTRQDFTKALINTLQTGASNLTLADSNEEAANLLALQTRQSLSTKALSLASQSDQNVLRLLQ